MTSTINMAFRCLGAMNAILVLIGKFPTLEDPAGGSITALASSDQRKWPAFVGMLI